MVQITAKILKEKFINFFVNKKHENFINTSILQKDDPTILFVNAGMVPFKTLFLNNSKDEYNNIVSIQKCVRLGGKKSDLHNVGKTNYHHTFFEMLGNFSFGKYFKKEAITYAWEFLTEILKISQRKLFVTVHTKDQESYEIWEKIIKIKKNKIIKKKMNFWEMGALGPCGFCSEIFYKKKKPVEIWNLVFIEYYRTEKKKLIKLNKKSIDTGMGLERILAIIEKKKTTYETTLFKAVRKKIKIIGKNLIKQKKTIFKILDHLRCCVVLIDEKIKPASTEKGYILRKLLRLLFEYCEKLLPDCKSLTLLISDCLNDLKNSQILITTPEKTIKEIITKELQLYEKNIEKSTKLIIKEIKNDQINGESLFKLYDTYGIKIDYIKNVTKKMKITLNMSDFQQKFTASIDKNRKISKKKNEIYNIIEL